MGGYAGGTLGAALLSCFGPAGAMVGSVLGAVLLSELSSFVSKAVIDRWRFYRGMREIDHLFLKLEIPEKNLTMPRQLKTQIGMAVAGEYKNLFWKSRMDPQE